MKGIETKLFLAETALSLKVSLLNYFITLIITLFVFTSAICNCFFTDSVMMSAMVSSADALGLDTLDEDENTRFLSNLKKDSSSSVGYPRLNQEQEPSTPTSPQRCTKK